MSLSFRVLAAGIFLTAPSPSILNVSAQSLTNLAGTWNNVSFSTPSRLTLQRDWVEDPGGGGGALVLREINEKGFFETSTGQIVAQSDGTFTGMASGTFTLPGSGRMVVSGAGFAPITFHMNAAGDFMFALKQAGDENIQDLELLLKAPDAMTGVEMAGTWKSVSFGTPARLVLEKETLTHTYVTNVAGTERFFVNTGTISVNADGTLTVTDSEGSLPGTYSQAGPGIVDVSLMGGAFTLRFFVNASKNVMASLKLNEPDSNELILMVKQPTNAEPADFKGLWRDGSFITPARLTQVRTNFNLVTDIPEKNDFEFYLGTVNVGHNAAFTSPDEPAYGLATLAGAGTVQTASTNLSGEVNRDTFWVNAAKDVMVGVSSDDGHKLTLVTRAPAESVRRESLGLMLVGATACWASDTNRVLQVSTNLNDWTDLTNTLGQSAYTPDPAAATNGFFRVKGT